VVAVRLTGRINGIYLAELELMGPRGRIAVPCRPSDAFVLAERQSVPAPILVDVRLIESDEDVAPA
jgi:bifunctional DNase/RNase